MTDDGSFAEDSPALRVVVGLEEHASEFGVAQAMAGAGVRDVRVLFAGVLVGEGMVDEVLLARLRRVPGVRYAEPDASTSL